ncbi:MAG TPA: ribosomal RNA small subunit methyltransferase A [bacterium]|nr:ribosomal RNA small subunit methyltransferase A [bacterium]
MPGKFRYKKRYGQNFLHNTSKLGQIASLINPSPGDSIIEIGPGSGSLTKLLLEAGAFVTAVEIDPEAVARLREKIGEPPNLKVITADFLGFDIRSAASGRRGKIKIAGNIPYYITTPIIEKAIESKNHVSAIYLTVQKEVGERMAAKEGSKTYSSLSIFCQYHADTELALKIPRRAFFPVPDVDSAFVIMRFEKDEPVEVKSESLFFTLVRGGFNQRRKTLANGLRRLFKLTGEEAAGLLGSTGIDERARPEDVSILQFARLSDVLYNHLNKI